MQTLQILPYHFYVHVAMHRNKFLFNKTNRCTNFSKFIFVKKLYMFRAVPLPIISSLLYIWHWNMSCKFDDRFQACSGYSILNVLESCHQTCVTCTNAVCTVENS
jgi:hypothetical protein